MRPMPSQRDLCRETSKARVPACPEPREDRRHVACGESEKPTAPAPCGGPSGAWRAPRNGRPSSRWRCPAGCPIAIVSSCSQASILCCFVVSEWFLDDSSGNVTGPSEMGSRLSAMPGRGRAAGAAGELQQRHLGQAPLSRPPPCRTRGSLG